MRAAAGRTRAVLLVLHGGRADGVERSRPWHLSALRLLPFARSLHRELGQQGVAVWSVRYRYRGWNGSAASPVADARAALDAVRLAHGQVPVVLLGHSMGARTALRVADDPLVCGVTALAPWLPEGEPVHVRDVVVRLVHGRDDRWTDPGATVRWAGRARPVAADLCARPPGRNRPLHAAPVRGLEHPGPRGRGGGPGPRAGPDRTRNRPGPSEPRVAPNPR